MPLGVHRISHLEQGEENDGAQNDSGTSVDGRAPTAIVGGPTWMISAVAGPGGSCPVAVQRKGPASTGPFLIWCGRGESAESLPGVCRRVLTSPEILWDWRRFAGRS